MSNAGKPAVAYSPESPDHRCTRSSHIAYLASALSRFPKNPTNSAVAIPHSVYTTWWRLTFFLMDGRDMILELSG